MYNNLFPNLLGLFIALLNFEEAMSHVFFLSEPKDRWEVSDSNCPGVRQVKRFGEQLIKSEISKSIKIKF